MEKYKKSELNTVKRGKNRATYNVDKINTIINAGFLGHVSFIFENKAISLPMAYAKIEDKIYLHGSNKNRMLLSLIETEEMSMNITHLDGLVLARSGLHHSVNYRSATLFGTCKETIDKSKKIVVLKQVIEQMVPNRWDSLRLIKDTEIDRTLVVEMTITTASAKIRNVDVKDEKPDEKLPIWAGIVPIKQVAEFPVSDALLDDSVKIPKHVLEYYKNNKA
jgi:nitroimidazol reductase NimA-like FMN-containing flavoprotein (pyridoxamine 5'-phosphate oxidase superfamily)